MNSGDKIELISSSRIPARRQADILLKGPAWKKVTGWIYLMKKRPFYEDVFAFFHHRHRFTIGVLTGSLRPEVVLTGPR